MGTAASILGLTGTKRRPGLEKALLDTAATPRTLLEQACEAFEAGRDSDGRHIASAVLERTRGREDTNLERAFAAALARRGHLKKTGVLYERDSSNWQLSLFDCAMKNLSILEVFTAGVASSIVRQIDDLDEEITLVDIGIGGGGQEAAFFAALSRAQRDEGRAAALRRIRVVGTDLTEGSLLVACGEVTNRAKELFHGQIDVKMEPRVGPVEDVKPCEWADIRKHSAKIILLCSLVLHHTAPSTRDRLVASLARDLRPDAVVLGEPHLDHATHVLPERFRSSYRHFALVWGLLAGLASEAERHVVALFFQREIEDAFALGEESRTEREELLPVWCARLAAAHLRLVDSAAREEIVAAARASTQSVIAPGLSIASHDSGWIGIDFRNDTILGIMVAHPSKSCC
jgi:SAM-dependent methyltransferase